MQTPYSNSDIRERQNTLHVSYCLICVSVPQCLSKTAAQCVKMWHLLQHAYIEMNNGLCVAVYDRIYACNYQASQYLPTF